MIHYLCLDRARLVGQGSRSRRKNAIGRLGQGGRGLGRDRDAEAGSALNGLVLLLEGDAEAGGSALAFLVLGLQDLSVLAGRSALELDWSRGGRCGGGRGGSGSSGGRGRSSGGRGGRGGGCWLGCSGGGG